MSDNYQVHSDAVEKSGRVVFVRTLPVEEWEKFQTDLLKMLAKGYLDWTFHLENVEAFSSVELGRLLSLHVLVKKVSGNLTLKVRRDSLLGRSFVEMHLHKALTISFT